MGIENQKILIAGAGIAGPTVAYWLKRAGFIPTLIERSPRPRAGGYIVDLWGSGFDVAEKMGMRADLLEAGYPIQEVRIVDHSGDRVAGFGAHVIKRLVRDRIASVLRGDLSELLLSKAKTSAEIIFDDTITHLRENRNGIDVEFKRSANRRFDLLIGADGINSGVRRLVFQERCWEDKRLGYAVAAFEADDYHPRDENAYVFYGIPGLILRRFALRDGKTLFLIAFRIDQNDTVPIGLLEKKALLKKRLRAGRWECDRISEELDRAETIYFDHVYQIRMQSWSRGRTALIGDAAFCPSLISSDGAGLAMTSAYVLAGELARSHGEYEMAFDRYENLLQSYIRSRQRVTTLIGHAFVPTTSWGLFLRNRLMDAANFPVFAKLTAGSVLADVPNIPAYFS